MQGHGVVKTWLIIPGGAWSRCTINSVTPSFRYISDHALLRNNLMLAAIISIQI